jgi:hypothetical protein
VAEITAKNLRRWVEELLALQGAVKRAEYLETQVEAGLKALKFSGFTVEGKGEVSLSLSKQKTIPPALIRQLLSRGLAKKVIREHVSLESLKALVALGELSKEQYGELLAGAEATPTISLQVRLFK